MSKKKKSRIPHKFHRWIAARKEFHLSHAHIQMARELGMNPKRFASQANNKSQPWKVPLPEFIESLYLKKFGKSRPDVVQSMEETAAEHVAKREARKAAKEAETESEAADAEAAEAADAEAADAEAIDQPS